MTAKITAVKPFGFIATLCNVLPEITVLVPFDTGHEATRAPLKNPVLANGRQNYAIPADEALGLKIILSYVEPEKGIKPKAFRFAPYYKKAAKKYMARPASAPKHVFVLPYPGAPSTSAMLVPADQVEEFKAPLRTYASPARTTAIGMVKVTGPDGRGQYLYVMLSTFMKEERFIGKDFRFFTWLDEGAEKPVQAEIRDARVTGGVFVKIEQADLRNSGHSLKVA